MRPQLSHGTVLHARLRPLRNAFCYRVFFLRFALSELHRLDNAVFPINRWNLFSFQYQDHGARDGSHPESWIRALLAQEGLNEADAEIWLQPSRACSAIFSIRSFSGCATTKAVQFERFFAKSTTRSENTTTICLLTPTIDRFWTATS